MKYPLSVLLLSIMPSLVSADWRADIGWNDLNVWLAENDKTPPSTSSVIVGQTEAGTNYIADYTSSQLDHITTFQNVSDTSSTTSDHATRVANYIFGSTSSLSPDVGGVYGYSADDFFNKIRNSNTSWPMSVMNHSYISSGTMSVNDTLLYTRSIDESTQSSDILHVVGMNNGSTNTIPQLWSYCYNGISVGRTDGLHSAGVVLSGYEGAGRQKPEVVNPQSSTSYATGATSSVAVFLRALADTHTSTNATLPLTIKSCILAGADKTKFPTWDNTLERPIDELYGAGETNIFNSYRILETAEQSTGSIPLRGWDHNGITSTEQVYTFTVPDYASSASISGNLSWNRTISTTKIRGRLVANYDELANLSLTLKDAGDNDIFKSDSPVDNLEHIWQTNLTPGTYTLTVDKSSGADTDYALAWRVDVKTNTAPDSFIHGPTSNELSFVGLIPSHTYVLQYSSNLTVWNDITTLTSSATGTLKHDHSNTALGQKVFYRLRYYTP